VSVQYKRLLQLFALLAAWGVVVVARLIQVQLVRHDHYVQKAQRQQERTLPLAPVRGSIVDARKRVLAESVAAVSIYADPQAITDGRSTARALAAIPDFGLTAKQIEQKLGSDGAFVWVARQLPAETGEAAKKLKLPGIYFLDEHRRTYPRGTLAANVVGYVGLDGEGLAGIEHAFDARIRGRAGRVTLLRDAKRGMYLVGGEGTNRPIDGDSIALTIDSVVQFIAERALQRAVDKYRAAGGSAIVMNPANGAVLAMASYPTFDPNRFREFGPDQWRNRNVQDMYEPGSTFKVVTASAALEEGLVTPSQILDCGNGEIQIGNFTIHEHGGAKYGLITFTDVIAHSSNVGSIRVGLALGQERFYNYIKQFGFGERTGIELPGETPGKLRRTQAWSQLSNASISIGQEIAVTPLQVATAIAAIANGGVRVAPHIIDHLADSQGDTILRPQRPAPVRVISEKTAAVLNEILKVVVSSGTGVRAALAEHIVAGKTGTAQKAVRGGYSPDRVVASFGGYVPADRPQLVILVVVDDPRGGQYGGEIAAPAFKEIAEASLRYMGVAPSIPARTLQTPPPVLAAFSQQRSVRTDAGVPDVLGLDARAAVASATAAGFRVRTLGSGVVQSQIPSPGGLVPEDRLLTLHLAEVTR
jgi:cell division protein FtsI (penicillin-binding protein 3)